MSKKGKTRYDIIIVLLCLIIVLSAVMLVASLIDKKKTETDGQASREITYQNETYALRENGIETVLLIGLDAFSDEGPQIESNSYTNNKRADFLLLFVIDNESKTVTPVQLNRDSMVEMNILGVAEQTVGRTTAQLALSHMYGAGGKTSCRNTASAVSRLLKGIGVTYYCSLTMDAVKDLNDLCGGVTLTVEDDFTAVDPVMEKGKTMTLTGEQALTYVRSRGSMEDPTNIARMKRQRTYMQALYGAITETDKKDPDFRKDTFRCISQYSVTNMSETFMNSLVDRLISYSVNEIRTVDGETKINEYTEFYPYEESVTELLVDLFYKKK